MVDVHIVDGVSDLALVNHGIGIGSVQVCGVVHKASVLFELISVSVEPIVGHDEGGGTKLCLSSQAATRLPLSLVVD